MAGGKKVVTSTSGSNYQKTINGGSNTSWNTYKNNKGLKKTLKKSEKSYNKALKKGFNAPYKNQLNSTIGKINNSKFEYDINNDALYNQYKEQYQAMGNTAMQEAQADATALTGGFANSYAESAGQRAYNSYISQLQQIVPQLYSQARQTYDTDLSNLYNKANLYSGLNNQAYTEYAAALDQKYNNMNYNYNKYWNDRQASAVTHTKNNTWSKSSGRNSQTSTAKKGK